MRPPYVLHRTKPDEAILGTFEDADYEPVYAARESAHQGGGQYTPSTYRLINLDGRVVDSFRLDCDGQPIDIPVATR